MLARAFYALISASRFTIELYLSCINTSHEWILFYATCHGRPYKQEVHGTSPRGLCLRIETSELHTAMCEHFLLLLNTGVEFCDIPTCAYDLDFAACFAVIIRSNRGWRRS